MRIKKGDTVIEVIISITIFALVAIISITLMQTGVNKAQGSLELTMARNEIDAQAEAIRFIQNSYIAEREVEEDIQQYAQLWHRITRPDIDGGLAIEADQLPPFNLTNCNTVYDPDELDNIATKNAFVVNTRLIIPSAGFSVSPYNNRFADYSEALDNIIISTRFNDLEDPEPVFRASPIYPRLIFTNSVGSDYANSSDDLVEGGDSVSNYYDIVRHAEGIWIIAVRGTPDPDRPDNPEFFDFHIRTCWHQPGNEVPSTIGTIVRLYNPEVVE
jgi:type II secretory pathway pseudopilin PulG